MSQSPLTTASALIATPAPVLVAQSAPLTIAETAAKISGLIAIVQSQAAQLQIQANQLPAAATAPSVSGQPYVNTTGNQVYFHYQASGHEYGTIPTGGFTSQPAYLKDITEAAAIGADGFSIDLGSLDAPTLDEMSRFFAAANQYNALHPAPAGSVNPAFTLFITLDCSTPGIEEPAPLAAAFLRFASDPAYTRVKDSTGALRPRFSTYGGAGGGGWDACKRLWAITLGLMRAGGVNPFFISGFETTSQVPDGPNPGDTAFVQGLLVGLADGAWEFQGNLPPLAPFSEIPQQENRSAAVNAAGLYRESCVRNGPGWASGSQPRFCNEWNGGEGLAAQWQSVLSVQKPKSVQILTWNDYDEASWTTNADEGPTSAWPYLYHSSVPGFYPSRLGLQKLYQYYIQWYKTGVQPSFTSDCIVAMYRPMTAAAAAAPTGDPLGGVTYSNDDTGGGAGVAHMPDVVYLDTFLTAGAVITLTQDNGVSVQRYAPAGHSHLRLPFLAGSVTLTASRNGQTVLTLPGQAIAGTAAYANANYWTGTAHN